MGNSVGDQPFREVRSKSSVRRSLLEILLREIPRRGLPIPNIESRWHVYSKRRRETFGQNVETDSRSTSSRSYFLQNFRLHSRHGFSSSDYPICRSKVVNHESTTAPTAALRNSSVSFLKFDSFRCLCAVFFIFQFLAFGMRNQPIDRFISRRSGSWSDELEIGSDQLLLLDQRATRDLT